MSSIKCLSKAVVTINKSLNIFIVGVMPILRIFNGMSYNRVTKILLYEVFLKTNLLGFGELTGLTLTLLIFTGNLCQIQKPAYTSEK
jgi:hypothetical protein